MNTVDGEEEEPGEYNADDQASSDESAHDIYYDSNGDEEAIEDCEEDEADAVIQAMNWRGRRGCLPRCE